VSDSEEEIGSAQQQLKIESQQIIELVSTSHREENVTTCIQDTSDFDK
jgi:hypothetical protein